MGEDVGFLESGAERGREGEEAGGKRLRWGWDWRGGDDWRLSGLGAEENGESGREEEGVD